MTLVCFLLEELHSQRRVCSEMKALSFWLVRRYQGMLLQALQSTYRISEMQQLLTVH